LLPAPDGLIEGPVIADGPELHEASGASTKIGKANQLQSFVRLTDDIDNSEECQKISPPCDAQHVGVDSSYRRFPNSTALVVIVVAAVELQLR